MKNHIKISGNSIQTFEDLSFSQGLEISEFPYHSKFPFLRKVFVGREVFNDGNIHIAVHFIQNANNINKKYSILHSHDVDEYNIILNLNDKDEFVYLIKTDKNEYEVTAPQSIFIPKGVRHSAEVIKGSGLFICIVMSGTL